MDGGKCELLGGTFSTLVQASLGLICIASLIVKRHNEVPQRDWYVWFLDVMKQAIGASFGHFSNIFLSVVIADSISEADECHWYFLTYVVDSTFGMAISIMFLRCFEQQILRYQSCSMVMKFGEYGNPPELCIWFPQLAFIFPLNEFVVILFSALPQDQPEVELVLVMIIIPTIMNTIQFWVTDTFLKRQDEEETGDSELDQGLIAEGRHRMDVEDPSFLYVAGRAQREGTEGIQLSAMGSGVGGSEYSSLPADSTHGGGSSGAIDGLSITEEDSSYYGDNSSRNKERTHSSSGKYTALPSLISGINAYLPTSWTGAHPGKLERVGSDEPLYNATNPLPSAHTASFPDKTTSSAGAAKGYFPHNTTSTVKLRSSVTTASSVTPHNGSNSSASLPSSSVSSGVSSAGAAGVPVGSRTIRTSSSDSNEYI